MVTEKYEVRHMLDRSISARHNYYDTRKEAIKAAKVMNKASGRLYFVKVICSEIVFITNG